MQSANKPFLCLARLFSPDLGPFCAITSVKKRGDLFVLVVTLLAHGCPVQAIVAAFGFDERTVCEWLKRSGAHCP
jgi:transposase-like protein